MLIKGDHFAFLSFDTSLGWMGIVGSTGGLKAVILPKKSKQEILRQVMSYGGIAEEESPDGFGDLPYRLVRYLEGEAVDFPDKLDLSGATYFQQNVWLLVRNIPYGETRSYGWVANDLGLPKAARAVGQALGKNPLPIIVPCHRVINSDGSLGGFGGGIKIKELFLRLERTTSVKL